MARVSHFEPDTVVSTGHHEAVPAFYGVVNAHGQTILQIDTYARDDLQRSRGKKQTIQIDREGARVLINVLKATFQL